MIPGVIRYLPCHTCLAMYSMPVRAVCKCTQVPNNIANRRMHTPKNGMFQSMSDVVLCCGWMCILAPVFATHSCAMTTARGGKCVKQASRPQCVLHASMTFQLSSRPIAAVLSTRPQHAYICLNDHVHDSISLCCFAGMLSLII